MKPKFIMKTQHNIYVPNAPKGSVRDPNYNDTSQQSIMIEESDLFIVLYVQKPTPDTPPRTGWQYWNEEWLDDDTIRVGRAGSGEINQFGLNCEFAFDQALIGEELRML